MRGSDNNGKLVQLYTWCLEFLNVCLQFYINQYLDYSLNLSSPTVTGGLGVRPPSIGKFIYQKRIFRGPQTLQVPKKSNFGKNFLDHMTPLETHDSLKKGVIWIKTCLLPFFFIFYSCDLEDIFLAKFLVFSLLETQYQPKLALY